MQADGDVNPSCETLLVSRSLPYSDDMVYGVFQRLDLFARALTAESHRVRCLFLVDQDFSLPPEAQDALADKLRKRWGINLEVAIAPVLKTGTAHLSRWALYGKGVYDYRRSLLLNPFFCAAAEAAVQKELAWKPKLIVAHRLPAMALICRHRESLRNTPVLFDMDDVEHLSLMRRLAKAPAWPGERLALMHIPSTMWAERKALKNAAVTFVCSESDREYLRRLFRSQRVTVLHNSVQLPAHEISRRTTSSQVVLFVGAYSYAPNATAAARLIDAIWPRIKAEIPQARLRIVGKQPELIPGFHRSHESVEFTGFLPDVADAYKDADVVCCPILSGGGTRIKLIEAAAFGVPMVSTTLGAEGLGFRPGVDIVLADSDAAMALACVRLLRDRAEASRLAQHAAERARTLYDREAIAEQLRSIVRSHLRRSRGADECVARVGSPTADMKTHTQ